MLQDDGDQQFPVNKLPVSPQWQEKEQNYEETMYNLSCYLELECQKHIYSVPAGADMQ